jgi:Ca2+-binding RTX toxin-like protein
VDVTLADHVENLVLTGSALRGTGNAAANQLVGNDGDNVLNGLGGADEMIGGAGNDTYVVDTVNDRVVEAAGAGTDTVQASVSVTLASEVENLLLTGSAAIDGTGNALDNVITGNGAANVLRGGAGGVDSFLAQAGNDRIVVAGFGQVGTVDGGAGDDTLQFTTPGLSIDLSGLVGRVQNVESLLLADGQSGAVWLDAAVVASLTDTRDTLSLTLDNGDQLTLGSPSVETGRSVLADGSQRASYSLFDTDDTSVPPVALINVLWLAPGAPPPGG